MKKLILFTFLLSTLILTAQNVDFKLNEDICYCSGGSPSSIVKMDNNWDLLLVLRQSKTMTQLDSLGVKYTLSQLKLLQQFNLIQKDKDDFYKTSIILLDSIRSKSLRNYSKQLSFDLTGEIKPKVLELKSHLQNTNRGKNIYSMLFSYVIDGMIWDIMDALETESIIEKPFAFKNPEQTKPHDIGDLIILVIK